MKQGDTIKIKVHVEAVMYGYKEKRVRIRIGNTLIWLPIEDLQEN